LPRTSDALRKAPSDRKLPSLVRDGTQVLGGLAEVRRDEWDALLDPAATPFVRWDWIEAMERSRCASDRSGWSPRHLALFARGRLIAAAPAWVKDDSDGDFARDWDWAGAAARAGLPYYPKLCMTVPFTPCSGRRVLVAPGEDRAQAVRRIADAARALCRREGIPSLQVLFPLEGEARELAEAGLSLRMGFQFHWRNEGYRTPEDFLARFRSKDRNAIKRERRAPAEQGIAIRTVRGDELSKSPREWAKAVHELHSSTVRKLMWGRGWLNRAFYDLVFERMPEALEVVEARRGGKLVAGAFNVAGGNRLYGRYWGAFEEHPFLHFNVCLYHSIDECIRRGVAAFEGGAGGDHKLSRGFLPSSTWSAHAFLDARLDDAMRRALAAETDDRRRALRRWSEQSPILKPA
jgi:predicted N-acyltransferase